MADKHTPPPASPPAKVEAAGVDVAKGSSPEAAPTPAPVSPPAAAPDASTSPPPATEQVEPFVEEPANVEPDEVNSQGGSDAGSTYASDVSETTSLSSSIFDYTYENGRRYHAYRAGQYLLPNDEREQERLDMTHHVFLLALNGQNCKTKLDNPQAILDIGTGTGIWAIEMGDMYPSAIVTGTDLSPIQSTWVPPNVHFEIDDANSEWSFPKNHFDLIHARTVSGAIQSWPAFLSQCFSHCKPGGFIEMVEGRADFFCDDDTLNDTTATWRWLEEFRRLSRPLGFDITPKLPGLFKEAGFEDVELLQKVVPCGTWPKDPALKEIGRWFRVQFLEMAIEAYTLALFTRVGGWSNDAVQVLLALVRAELKSNKLHVYTYVSFTTGRRPL
ncbi:S-adenosyl-L-methionine-dependent methyltransferase [Podospora didyma]|uniref:S-adenosyl-L-methionine-dependent methyltransferase n=1 Tax=Podospora didyma TaxID=330526 RepID=A0AAE0NWR8_9PEZI|nr:S-adenosyl-L-methionine-dependent methyltransferase [Podospora didyma]